MRILDILLETEILIFCEAEDYRLHNIVAEALNRIDTYRSQLRLALRHHLIMDDHARDIDRGLNRIRSLIDFYSQSDMQDQGDQFEEDLQSYHQWLDTVDEELSRLPKVTKPATGFTQALGVYLGALLDATDSGLLLVSDEDQQRRAQIRTALKMSYEDARTGHPWRALFGALRARKLFRSRRKRLRGDLADWARKRPDIES